MVNIVLSLYGTLCAVSYMGVAVFLALVSVFLFASSVVVVAQALERLIGHTGSSLLGPSHSSCGY